MFRLQQARLQTQTSRRLSDVNHRRACLCVGAHVDMFTYFPVILAMHKEPPKRVLRLSITGPKLKYDGTCLF